MARRKVHKLSDEAYMQQVARHQECWHRYVQCKQWYRELLKSDIELAEEILSLIADKHYSLTEELFNSIKEKSCKNLKLK